MLQITDEERSAANRMRVPKSWEASAQARPSDSVSLTQDLAAQEASLQCRDPRWGRAILLREIG